MDFVMNAGIHLSVPETGQHIISSKWRKLIMKHPNDRINKGESENHKEKPRIIVTWLLACVFALLLLHTAQTNAAILTVNCATGPFVTINGAIAAAANGDTIMVEACAVPYIENVTIAGFTSLHVVGVTPPDATGAGGDYGAKAAGVGAAVNSLTIVNGAGLGGACFDIQNSTDVKIQNFSLVNCALGGVRIRTASRVLVLANRIISHPGANGILAINTDDLVVSSNLIAVTGKEGILLDDTRISTVADNFVIRAAGAGIRLNDGANNRVDNNDVRSSGLQGLVVSGIEARIERNSFSQNGAGADILVDLASINADIVGNSAPAGINDSGAGTEMANNF